jgi:hypothetical protein
MEWFSKTSIGETFDNTGQKIDIEEVGDYQVVAYNYFDGHKMASVIIASDIEEARHFDIVTDTALIEKYWEVVDNKERSHEEQGIVYYNCQNPDYEVTKSIWQGTFSICRIHEK